MLDRTEPAIAQLDHVNSILADLEADLDAHKLTTQEKKQLLEQLKVYGRSPENADPVSTRRGLGILGEYAFKDGESTVSQEALRCMANALLLQPPARQILVDLNYGPLAAHRLKNDSADDEFLISRILFLTTYGTTLDYAQLVRENQLADHINAAIQRHAQRYSRSNRDMSREHTNPMELMALSETLKLLFNILHFHANLSEHFSSSIPNVFKILVCRDIPQPPLEQPINHLVNLLLNLELEDKKDEDVEEDDQARRTDQKPSSKQSAVFPDFDQKCNAERLITILDKAIGSYPEAELDNVVAPILTLVRRIYEIAPPTVQTHMQDRILPSHEERDKPLGKSGTLSSRLLNLSTSAFTPNLRGSISAMMFELSAKDPATFVQNVGYGYASGFLMSNNIPMPEDIVKAHEASSPKEQNVPVNPITGQRLDRETIDQSEPMTQEEKEREAERLFVLFERLRATGVMDVQNPVEAAYRSGRIEELSDDSD